MMEGIDRGGDECSAGFEAVLRPVDVSQSLRFRRGRCGKGPVHFNLICDTGAHVTVPRRTSKCQRGTLENGNTIATPSVTDRDELYT